MLVQVNQALDAVGAFDVLAHQVPRIFGVEVLIGEEIIASFRSIRIVGDADVLKQVHKHALAMGVMCSISSKGYLEAPSVWVTAQDIESLKASNTASCSFEIFGNVCQEQFHEHEIVDEKSASQCFYTQGSGKSVRAIA